MLALFVVKMNKDLVETVRRILLKLAQKPFDFVQP